MPEATVIDARKFFESAIADVSATVTLRSRRPQPQTQLQHRQSTTPTRPSPNRMDATWASFERNGCSADDGDADGGGGGDPPNVCKNDAWGFRITGGAEFGMPITVFHVSLAVKQQ